MMLRENIHTIHTQPHAAPQSTTHKNIACMLHSLLGCTPRVRAYTETQVRRSQRSQARPGLRLTITYSL